MVINYLFKKLRKFEKHRRDAVIELLPIKGEKLLDVACGEGELINQVAERFKELRGVDIELERIEKAKREAQKKGFKHVVFEVVDVNNGLPFRDEFFEVVTAVAALAFFFDPYFVMKEFRRVLKKSGLLIIEVPNLAFLPRRISLLFGRQPWVSLGPGWDGGHLHYFTKGSLINLIEDSGFEIAKVSGSGIFSSLRSWYPSLLCGNLIVKAIKK